MSGQLHIPAPLSTREQPLYLLHRRLSGPQKRVLTVWEEANLLPIGIEPEFLGYRAHILVTIHTQLSRFLEKEIRITKLIGRRYAPREYEMRKK